MALQRIYYFLKTKSGSIHEQEWLNAAERAVKHLLEGQAPSGQWPYYFDAGGCDAGHHSMCMFYLAEAASFPVKINKKTIWNSLQRGADWLIDEALLETQYGTKINWARNKSACLYFSSEYFLIAAALASTANMGVENADEYRHEALELMRYIRTDLWNNPNYETEGPLRLTEAGIKIGYAWFGQSMGWVVYQLDDMIEQMKWWER
jgi:hypothetical protein